MNQPVKVGGSRPCLTRTMLVARSRPAGSVFRYSYAATRACSFSSLSAPEPTQIKICDHVSRSMTSSVSKSACEKAKTSSQIKVPLALEHSNKRGSKQLSSWNSLPEAYSACPPPPDPAERPSPHDTYEPSIYGVVKRDARGQRSPFSVMIRALVSCFTRDVRFVLRFQRSSAPEARGRRPIKIRGFARLTQAVAPATASTLSTQSRAIVTAGGRKASGRGGDTDLLSLRRRTES